MNLENTMISKKEALRFLRDIGIIDPHFHARDMEEHQKFTIAKSRRLASFYGVEFIGLMPNTNPTITNEETLLRYLEIAKKSDNTGVKYMIWFGLTADTEQVKKFVELYDDEKYKGIILGAKEYAGPSTGSLAILEEYQLRDVLETLNNCGYTGSIAFHCEEKGLFCPKKYNPEKPETWKLERPEISEVYSVNKVIRLVKETNFQGHVHICHVSSHISVLAINEARKQGMKISCGATIHHLICDTEQMAGMSRKDAVEWKCNPAIGGRDNRILLLEDFKVGLIDIVESDFAPHTRADKIKHNASGVHNYQYWPDLIIELKAHGFSDQRIKEVLRERSLEIFKRIKV
jgi:dihydroorotase